MSRTSDGGENSHVVWRIQMVPRETTYEPRRCIPLGQQQLPTA
jgi:hypothetical protein